MKTLLFATLLIASQVVFADGNPVEMFVIGTDLYGGSTVKEVSMDSLKGFERNLPVAGCYKVNGELAPSYSSLSAAIEEIMKSVETELNLNPGKDYEFVADAVHVASDTVDIMYRVIHDAEAHASSVFGEGSDAFSLKLEMCN